MIMVRNLCTAIVIEHTHTDTPKRWNEEPRVAGKGAAAKWRNRKTTSITTRAFRSSELELAQHVARPCKCRVFGEEFGNQATKQQKQLIGWTGGLIRR